MLSVVLNESDVKRVMITEGFSRKESTRIHVEREREGGWGTSYIVSVPAAGVVFLNVEPGKPHGPVFERELWPMSLMVTPTPARMRVELRDTGMVRIMVDDGLGGDGRCVNTLELCLFAPFAGPAVEVIDGRGCVVKDAGEKGVA